jgi:hypothetical protein
MPQPLQNRYELGVHPKGECVELLRAIERQPLHALLELVNENVSHARASLQ